MLTTLFFVSLTLRKTTASTPTEMLSFVIASCLGMSIVLILKSLVITVSIKGHLKKTPGPTVFKYLPNLSIIASSHSLFILTEEPARGPPTKARKPKKIPRKAFPILKNK